MDHIAYNLKQNTYCKIAVMVAALVIVIGVFLNFINFGEMYSEELYSVAIKDMPIYCPTILLIIAAAMIFVTLLNKMIYTLVLSAIGLTVDIVLGIICSNEELLLTVVLGGDGADLISGFGDVIGRIFGVDNATDYLFEAVGEYIKLGAGFYIILIACVAGIVFSIMDVKNIGSIMSIPSIPPEEYKQGLLRGVSGESVGLSIVMDNNDTIVLGRDPKLSGVVLREDKKVSRKHCSITLRNEEFFIIDYSSNGTIANGYKLQREKETFLGNQASISLSSNTEFTVKIKQN